ncbi:hypothetical protein NDA11_000250 [Ustilago hordei]|nr:hypothetical protein NDA10_002379 [Ustilago hordei]KAJ1579210.1 hypothetical protein NDA11_000250 [Ustilago hordei]KAJ1598596.1 hypothetical protein NDA14_004775 [Ustilago hordei]UTT90859.1 hypothetical protein NDA17_005435 [Ustilago hordei]
MKLPLHPASLVLSLFCQKALAPIVPKSALTATAAFLESTEQAPSLADLINRLPQASAPPGPSANPSNLIPPLDRELHQLSVPHQAWYAQASSSTHPVQDILRGEAGPLSSPFNPLPSSNHELRRLPLPHQPGYLHASSSLDYAPETSMFVPVRNPPVQFPVGHGAFQQWRHYHPSIQQGLWPHDTRSRWSAQLWSGSPPFNFAPVQHPPPPITRPLDLPPHQNQPSEQSTPSLSRSNRPSMEEASSKASLPGSSSTGTVKLPQPKQDSKRLSQAASTSRTIQPAALALQDIDPLAASGKHVSFVYQEDPLTAAMVAQMKQDLGFAEPSKARGARNLGVASLQDFIQSMNYFLKGDRLFKELVFFERRFLVTVGGNIGRLSRTLKSQGLYVFELKTDGEQVFMICRGSYTFDPKYWKFVETATSFATKRAFIFHTVASTPTETGIITIQSTDARNFAERRDPMHWLTPHDHQQESSSPSTVSFSNIIYDPDPNLLPNLKFFFENAMGGCTRNAWRPQVVIPEERQTFTAEMRRSLRLRSILRAFQLQGKTYYITFHRTIGIVEPVSKPFVVVWEREQREDRAVLKAVAILPMSKHTYDNLVRQAVLKGHHIELGAGSSSIIHSRNAHVVDVDD